MVKEQRLINSRNWTAGAVLLTISHTSSQRPATGLSSPLLISIETEG